MGAILQTPRDRALAPLALAAAQAIEDELKRLGWWSTTPPTPADLADAGPFGQNTLSFAQWLQFVLLDRVRATAAGQGSFPASSSVATRAFREFDGYPEASDLVHRLHQFDDLFESKLLAVAQLLHPRGPALLTVPPPLADPNLFALPLAASDPAVLEQLDELRELLDGELEINERDPVSGMTPLLLTIALGCDAAEQALLEHGADPTLCDNAGRNAFDWRILRLQARLRRVLPGLVAVRSARIAQLYFPNSRQFSTALVVLELDGPLPPDALAALPATDPAILMPLGADAVSRLAQLEPPFWQRADASHHAESKEDALASPRL